MLPSLDRKGVVVMHDVQRLFEDYEYPAVPSASKLSTRTLTLH